MTDQQGSNSAHSFPLYGTEWQKSKPLSIIISKAHRKPSMCYIFHQFLAKNEQKYHKFVLNILCGT